MRMGSDCHRGPDLSRRQQHPSIPLTDPPSQHNRFFPIFFKQEVMLSPSGVTLVYCAIPLVLSLFSFLTQIEASLVGRVQAIVLNRWGACRPSCLTGGYMPGVMISGVWGSEPRGEV